MTGYNYYQERANFGSPRITWAVHRLILVNILVFACQLLLDPLQVFFGGGFVDAIFGFQPGMFMQGYLYKPFTYQFMHGGLMHLGMNMLWLFFFGPDVERTLGTRQFYRFYIICGALSVLATFFPFVLTGHSPSILGASGAVMGVLVAFAMIEPDRQFFLFPIPTPITARFLVLIIVVMNIITALSDSPVSVTTHFGGMAVGYLYMRFLPKINAWQRERRRAASAKTEQPGADKIGEAVDNIFKFEKKDRK
jgi:membrane associated rhomboid family serine protease